ncbi:MAG: anthranilate synthase component I, partial [Alphaproteobacteria bacterium]
MVSPDPDIFARRYESGQSQIVHTALVADLETPVSAMLKLTGGKAPSFLLESVEGGATRGRYSIIGLEPDLLWRCRDGQAAINPMPAAQPEAFTPVEEPALESLRALVRATQVDHHEGLPPAIAGLVGYLGYDMVRLVERLGTPKDDPLDLPDALLMRPQLIAVLDGVRDELILATPVRPRAGVTAKAAYVRALERLETACQAIERPLENARPALDGDAALATPVSNTGQRRFEEMVRKAQDYILAGDIFQVVLSQRFSAPFPLPATALYRALRRVNPSPFLFLLNFADFQVVGSSPEILVRLRDNEVTIRPIAGTRPRGATAAEDRALADGLLADPK